MSSGKSSFWHKKDHHSGGATGEEHRRFLAGVTLREILDARDKARGSECKLVDAAAQSTLIEAVQMMHDKKIKHLPVYSMTPPMNGNEAEKFYVGVVSVSDILSGIHEKSLRGDEADDLDDGSRDDPVTLIDLLKTVSRQWIYPSFHHLDVVLQPILGGEPAIIVQRYKDHKKDSLAVVTQTDIGRFLLFNIDKLDDTLNRKKLGDTILGTKEHFDESFTVDCSKTAAAAFHRMHFYHHESLAVVDNSFDASVRFRVHSRGSISSHGYKKIIANLSASDLRGLSEEDLRSLEHKSVLDFLKEKRTDSSKGHRAPVTVTPSTTIGGVLRTLVQEHINQVWVVSEPESGKLVSQVLLTEIMELFMIHPYTV